MASWVRMGTEFAKQIHGKVPADFEKPMQNLVAEMPWISANQAGTVAPYGFLDGGRWDGSNGWFPLFFEWSAEYYHIPYTEWDFAPRGPEAKVQYGIKQGIDLSSTPNLDYVALSGRSPILPQVSASLRTILKQLFSKMNPTELDHLLPEADRQPLLDSATDLQYISAAMQGFTKQLVTRMQGTHVTPNSRPHGGTPTVLQDALKLSSEIGMDATAIGMMDLGTQFTPVASLVPIPADPTQYSPFKPVTHGQFRFTKLKILDRFGQLVTTENIMNETPAPVFPCLGETYSLQQLADGSANAVLHRKDQQSCFVQLPPSINQPARLNAEFVTSTAAGWRPLDEWENPVCGWVVVNLPDFSLQVFDADGHFLREFGFMGSTSSRPFPPVAVNNTNPLLAALMKKLADENNVKGLSDTIANAAETVKHPPTQYAESMLSFLGKPFALVQMGFSLELMDPPLTNQSTLAPKEGPSVTDYPFPMKIGDANNTFDGLAGYFKPLTAQTFDLGSFYSEFAPAKPTDSTDPSKPMPGHITLQPFYAAHTTTSAADYAATRNSHLQIFAGLIDPFVPVHAYTQLLPLKHLALPPWAISLGIDRLSAFFRMGPFLIPTDVPAFDSKTIVAHDYLLDEHNRPTTTGSMPLPTVEMGDWVWLQPFWDASAKQTEYNFVCIDPVAKKPEWKDGPSTVVEGYLQMTKPFAASQGGKI